VLDTTTRSYARTGGGAPPARTPATPVPSTGASTPHGTQRTSSDDALAALLARAVLARASAGGAILQRKFGFEVETNIDLRSIATANLSNESGETMLDELITIGPSAAEDDSVAREHAFQIKVDHHRGRGRTHTSLRTMTNIDSGTLHDAPTPRQVEDAKEFDDPYGPMRGPIVEMVTLPPLDEFTMTETDVRNAMIAMGTTALALRDLPSRASLKTVCPSASDAVRVGVPGQHNRLGDILGNVEIQTTAGIQLEHVAQYLEHAAAGPADEIVDPEAGPWPVPAEQSLRRAAVDRLAIRNGRLVAEAVMDAPDPRFVGALIAASRYLLTVHYVLGHGWNKNMVGTFLYKSKLSETFAAFEFGGAENIEVVKRALLHHNRVTADSTLRGTGDIEVGPWLDEVLSGRDDRAFEIFKNPYSEAITPAGVGRSDNAAVVMEKRGGSVPRMPGAAPTWTQAGLATGTEDWAQLGLGVYHYLRALHEVE
jgi:hypothetical protein